MNDEDKKKCQIGIQIFERSNRDKHYFSDCEFWNKCKEYEEIEEKNNLYSNNINIIIFKEFKAPTQFWFD